MLELAFPTEEDEGIAFSEHARTRDCSRPVARIIARVRVLFERLGIMLRGLGYRSAQDIPDAVLVTEAGRRETGAALHPNVLDTVYSTQRGRPKDEFVAGVLNRKLNPEAEIEA